MSRTAGPPAYAWDWFARQRLLWREARSRIAATPDPVARRYGLVSAKPDVLPMLRADFASDELVHDVVVDVVRDLVFLGNVDRSFADLGLRNAPRGLRWWWHELTGEEVEAPPPAAAPSASDLPRQLDLDEVFSGYGDL